ITILLYSLLLIIPGIVKAATLALVTEGAYREPRREPLALSAELVAGRRPEVLGLVAATWIVVVVVVTLSSFTSGALIQLAPMLAWPGSIAVDAIACLGEYLELAVGLAALYGLSRDRGIALSRPPGHGA